MSDRNEKSEKKWSRRRVADVLAVLAGIAALGFGMWWLATGDPAPALSAGTEPTIWDRALTNRLLDLLRIALLLAGSFFVGAIVQRAVTGDFHFRAGGVELPELEAEEIKVTTEVLKQLRNDLDKVSQTEKEDIRTMLRLFDAMRQSTQAELAQVRQDLQLIKGDRNE